MQWLALGFSPTEIVEFVNEKFDKTCSRQNIHEHYARNEAAILALRAELAEQLDALPFGSKVERVAHLGVVAQKIYKKLRVAGAGNRTVRDMGSSFAAILKQIAEETGQLVHKHEHTGKDGQPLLPAPVIPIEDLMKLEPAELERQHREALAQSAGSQS